MKTKIFFTILLGIMSLSAMAEEKKDTTTLFLDKFEAFVVGIENNDSITDWTSCNAEYKALRTEYRNAHKKNVSGAQFVRYNKLKARYLKQVSLKKVGSDLKDKTTTVGSAVKETVQEVIKK